MIQTLSLPSTNSILKHLEIIHRNCNKVDALNLSLDLNSDIIHYSNLEWGMNHLWLIKVFQLISLVILLIKLRVYPLSPITWVYFLLEINVYKHLLDESIFVDDFSISWIIIKSLHILIFTMIFSYYLCHSIY